MLHFAFCQKKKTHKMIVAIWFTMRVPWLKLTTVEREKNKMHGLQFLRSLIPCLCFVLMPKKVRENPWEENAKSQSPYSHHQHHLSMHMPMCVFLEFQIKEVGLVTRLSYAWYIVHEHTYSLTHIYTHNCSHSQLNSITTSTKTVKVSYLL